MESLSSHSTPPPHHHHHIAAMAHSQSPHHHQFLKMEDLHASPEPSPAPSAAADDDDCTSAHHHHHSSSPPAPVVVQSKPAKKRKSWGQELPEPKTALPPRKRAKTDDEKEQRRIERIKRNRAAAHNSRERKRQETETLAVALAHANAKLQAYRNLHGPLPAHIVLPEVHLSTDENDVTTTTTTTATQQVATPAPSLVESHGSNHGSSPGPDSPSDDIFKRDDTPCIKQEPLDTSHAISFTPAFDNLDSKSSVLSPLDLTQHSAAMLCDLQCRSSGPTSTTTSTTAYLWTHVYLYQACMQLQTCYRTLAIALWMTSPSRMAAWMRASALRSTSPSTTSSTTLRLSRSTPRCLALFNAATGLGAPRKGALSLDQGGRSEQAGRADTELARAHPGMAMALSEEHCVVEADDHRRQRRSGADDVDENQGVRRGELT